MSDVFRKRCCDGRKRMRVRMMMLHVEEEEEEGMREKES